MKEALLLPRGRKRIKVFNGQVQKPREVFPFDGTCVEMMFNTDREIGLANTFVGLEVKKEDAGNVVVEMRKYARSFGNRITAEKIRNVIKNTLVYHPGRAVEIDMDGIVLITSSFADELFGKLYVDLGLIDFTRYIRLKNLDQTCKTTIDKAIRERITQETLIDT